VYQGSPRYMAGSVLLILLVFWVVFCLFTLHVYLGSPRYLVGSVLLILLVFCVVFCLSYSSRVPGLIPRRTQVHVKSKQTKHNTEN
jgi:hypothetical protein